MKKHNINRVAGIACAVLLLFSGATAQTHRWAGRELGGLEWAVHERLASLPMRGAFETVDFEIQGSRVTLSGQVLKDSLRKKSERAVLEVKGVQSVVNRIEVLPSSKGDDILRMNLYRVIYKNGPQETSSAPQVHIIVRNGWVTLEGTVNSDAERAAIHKQALGITPHVFDQLRVAPEQEQRAEVINR